MRIISQDGTSDFPYDNCVIWRDGTSVSAYFTGLGETIMAQYSSVEKAGKAMLLLKKIYVKAPLENDAKEMGEFVCGTYKAVGTSGYIEPESSCFVFRFPREDEI